jgi:hypothetical protein
MIFSHCAKIARPAYILLVLLSAVLASAVPLRAATAGERLVAGDHWVKDVQTGLMWDRDGNAAGKLLSWDDAVDFIKMLNSRKFAGHSDWRMPDIDEIRKLADAAKETAGVSAFTGDTTIASVLNRLGFHDVQASDYWSSTISIYNDTEAWYMSMKSGNRSAANYTLYMYVLPVRAD